MEGRESGQDFRLWINFSCCGIVFIYLFNLSDNINLKYTLTHEVERCKNDFQSLLFSPQNLLIRLSKVFVKSFKVAQKVKVFFDSTFIWLYITWLVFVKVFFLFCWVLHLFVLARDLNWVFLQLSITLLFSCSSQRIDRCTKYRGPWSVIYVCLYYHLKN